MRVTRLGICILTLAVSAGCAAEGRVGKPAAESSVEPRRDRLTASEWGRLRAGERVEHPRAFRGGGHGYVGGVSYQMVRAEPDEVLRALLDPSELQRMLPQTRSVRPVGKGHPAPGLELEQGNDLVQATYSVRLDHDLENREVRFRLDRSRPSDIEDVEGFFRVAPAGEGRSLITVGTALDVGSALVRLLFEDTIQRLILATPTQIKDVIEASSDVTQRDRVAQLP